MELHENWIAQTKVFVKQELKGVEGGHDWWHIERVWKLAKHLAIDEKANLFVVEMAALLHDIADSKFHGGDETVGSRKARIFMEQLEVDQPSIEHIISIIQNVSFKGGKIPKSFQSNELDIVQDADRLDAMGAIGIARTFNYGGYKNREIYNPEIAPNLNMTKEEYKSSTAPTINHFYEKLLLLKDLMNTKTGKQMAQHRHLFMEQFLEEFYLEWEGKV